MLDKLRELKTKFDELNEKLSDPEIIADQNTYRSLVIEHAELEPIVETFGKLEEAEKGLEEARELLELKRLNMEKFKGKK